MFLGRFCLLNADVCLICSCKQNYSGEEDLCCVYVPTNHLYIGDIFLVNSNDVIRPNLSVREGIGMYNSYFVISQVVALLVGLGMEGE